MTILLSCNSKDWGSVDASLHSNYSSTKWRSLIFCQLECGNQGCWSGSGRIRPIYPGPGVSLGFKIFNMKNLHKIRIFCSVSFLYFEVSRVWIQDPKSNSISVPYYVVTDMDLPLCIWWKVTGNPIFEYLLCVMFVQYIFDFGDGDLPNKF